MNRGRLLRARLRPLLRIGGVLVVVASLYFVGLRLSHQLAPLRELLSPAALLLLAGGAVLYGASMFVVSYAFWLLLRGQGALGLGLGECHRIYCRSQMAKYLPGNVLQFVVRHVTYRARGIGDGALGLAAVYEALGLAGSAACLALLGLPVLGERVVGRGTHELGVLLALGLGLGAAVSGIWLIPGLVAWVMRRRGQASLGAPLTPRQVSRILPLYAAFFLLNGVMAVALHAHASAAGGLRLELIPGYALAWLCGYVIPGASAGLGIREAVLLLLVGDDSATLFTAMGMRLISTLGDVVMLVAVTLWGVSPRVD